MNHEMILAETDAGGTEKWTCFDCDREILLTWEPFSRTVLVPGDVLVPHTGGKGGVSFSGLQVRNS